MSPFLDELRARLEDLKVEGLHRQLKDPAGIDFSSNDYLGLSKHPALREQLLEALRTGPLSSPASRLLRGNTPEHEALEEELARFKETEAALLFPSGYQANVAVLSTLLGPQDRALSDSENHASIIDGIRLSGCEKVVYSHLDADEIEKTLKRPARGRTFIVTESLFSMAGDIAPLDRYAKLAERHDAALIIDDAHATGVYGEKRGSGLLEEFGIAGRATAIVSTFGKALGLFGAFVAGPGVMIDYLINKARPFIFSTAPPPLLLAAISAALQIAASEPLRRKKVILLAARLRALLRAHGVNCLESTGPIVPVLLGENERALKVAQSVERRGYDVRAIRPPSVALGTARLRISVHADHTEAEVDGLASAIIEALAGDRAELIPLTLER